MHEGKSGKTFYKAIDQPRDKPVEMETKSLRHRSLGLKKFSALEEAQS